MIVTPTIKCEVDSEDENVEEPGQSSFDLASNNPDVQRIKHILYYIIFVTCLLIKRKFHFADFKSRFR